MNTKIVTAAASAAPQHVVSRARKAALTTVSVTALGIALAGLSGQAFAQQADAPVKTAQNIQIAQAQTTGAPVQKIAAAADPAQNVEEVVITGSRIVRRDYTSNSPIVTVNAQTFEQTSDVAVEATLNKLPEFTPSQNLTGSQSRDFSPTDGHSVGISTLSLRGLGSNRNLVLEDGMRMTPVNGSMVIDVNDIPSAMIDRVEVITGGASAVYGADAVGGVVNFILKKNFQGLILDSQWGQTQAGDGREYKVDATMGTNFADGKGNVTLTMERYVRAPSFQRNRDFYTKGYSDPTVGNNEGVFIGGAYHPEVGNFASQTVVNGLFPNVPAGTRVPNGGADFYFNSDGTVFGGAGGLATQGSVGSTNYKGVINGTTVAKQTLLDTFNSFTAQTGLKTNDLALYVTAPLSRWAMSEYGHYEINDWLSVFMNGSFTKTATQVAGSPATFVNGWSVEVPYDSATNGVASGHPVPTQLATLLNSRTNPNAPWDLFLSTSPDSGWLPGRGETVTTQVFQANFGLNGKVPTTDWTWTLYGSHGESTENDIGNGFASLQRYKAILLANNWGQAASITGNPGLPGAGFNAGVGTCTSGFYNTIFGGGASPSADCVAAITAPLQTYTHLEQNIVEFDAQGGLFNLPAGQVRGSVGADYRDDSEIFTPDGLESTTNFVDQVVGGNAVAPTNAKISTKEVYGELLIPVIDKALFIKHFDLNLGARYSTYSNAPSGLTYKILGDLQVNDWIRLRGGYNLAVRAPNLAESFEGKQLGFGAPGATAYGDPCSLKAIAPYGANAATNTKGAAGAAQTLAICQALMGPAATATYYGLPQTVGAPAASGSYYSLGNPNLDTEKAHTYTAGIVLRSPFDAPLLSRLTTSLDWYRITIDGAIQLESADIVSANCYNQTGAAAQVALSAACGLIVRNQASGQDLNKTVQYNNLATVDIQGLDFQIDWSAGLKDMWLVNSLPGSINVHFVGSVTDHYRTQTQPGQPVREWVGTLGTPLTGLDPGVYKYKTNTTFGYMVGPLALNLNWRYLPRIHSATYGQVGNNTLGAGSSSLFDLAGTYDFGRRYTLRAGVENLFDAEPKITGASVGIAGNKLATTGQGTTNEGLYDALGRRFFVGLKAKF